MAIRKRAPDSSKAAVEKLANDLADKPYGEQPEPEERLVRTSLSLPASMQETLEDMAIRNKRAGSEDRTVSAIVRVAITQYLNHKS